MKKFVRALVLIFILSANFFALRAEESIVANQIVEEWTIKRYIVPTDSADIVFMRGIFGKPVDEPVFSVPVVSPVVSQTPQKHHNWVPSPKMGPTGLRFVWGAEFGATVDMSGNEMSSIDFNAAFGLGYKWLSFAGVGAGANIVINNSNRTYPIFALIRTDFSQLVKFLFLDLRGGVALNYLEGNSHQEGLYLSPSIGFNLATGRTFRSYLTLGYTYINRRDYTHHDDLIHLEPLSMASIRLGVAF